MTIWYEILFHSLPPSTVRSPTLLLPGCCQPAPAELHMAIMWFSFDFRLYHQIKDNLCCHQFIFPAPPSNEWQWQIIQPIDYTLTCVHLHHPPGHGLEISSGSLIGAFSVCNHLPHSPLNLNGTPQWPHIRRYIVVGDPDRVKLSDMDSKTRILVVGGGGGLEWRWHADLSTGQTTVLWI